MAGSLILVAMYAAPTSAAGVTPAKIGWWTQAQQSGTTGNNNLPFDQAPGGSDFHVSNAGCPGQTTPCADVPNPANDTYPVGVGPTAISAVAYDLPGGGLPAGTDPGTVIAELKLTVSGAPVGSGFKLLACKSLSAWIPAKGGDWAQRPGYQAGGCSVGVPSADGTTVGFTLVAALAGRTNLDLTLVPAIGDPTPFQVQFKSDDPAALSFKPIPPARPFVPQPIPDAFSANTALATGVGGYAAPAIGSGLSGPAAGPAAQGGPAVTVGAAPGRAAQSAAGSADQRIIWLLLAATLAVFAANWGAPLRRMLSFDRSAVRGVGRFVRARTAQATPL
jgi:hypothetical protein